jgi:septal ring factor EnvC (AmiA/AmiB activator)
LFLSSSINPQTIEEYRSKLEKIKSRINEERVKREEMAKKELTVIGDIQNLQIEIEETEENIKIVNEEMDNVKREIEKLKVEIDELKKKLEKRQDELGGRLVSLYKLGKFSELRILSRAKDYSDFIRRVKFLIIVAEANRNLAVKIKKDKENLEDYLIQLSEYKTEVEEYQRLYKEEKRKLERKIADLESILGDVRGKKKSYEKMIRELENQSDELVSLIQRMTKKVPEEEIKFNPPSKQYIKGVKVIAPTKGQIVKPFGKIIHPVYGTVTRNEGIDISASLNQEVTTVMSGKVIFSDWFKGYGKMVIIDHGDKITTIYAHLNDIYVGTGESVSEGDIIGSVGNTGTLGEPLLHFEIRTNGTAIDPAQWLMENIQ